MKEQFQKLDLTALERLPGHRFSDSRWKPTRTLRSSPTRNKKKSGVIKDFSIIMRMSQMELTVIVCSLVVTRDNLIGSCKRPSWSNLTTLKQPHPKSTSGGKLVLVTRWTVVRPAKKMWPHHIYMYQVLQRNLGRFFAEWARPMERESRITATLYEFLVYHVRRS